MLPQLIAWDASTMTATLNGNFPLSGIVSFTPGTGLELGKQQYQLGAIAPTGTTRGLFKGDDMAIKFQLAGYDLFAQYLFANGGAAYSDSIYGVKATLTIVLNRQDGTPIYTVIYQDCQFTTGKIDDISSPDNRDAITAEVKFLCHNRCVNGIWDVNETIGL